MTIYSVWKFGASRMTIPTGRRSTDTRGSRSSGRRSRPCWSRCDRDRQRDRAREGRRRRSESAQGERLRAAVLLELQLPAATGTSPRRSCVFPSTAPRSCMHAKDVLHSFWVPEFRQKQDLVPGITPDTATSRRTGSGRIRSICTELCGLGHALMRSRVIVMQPDAFEQWADEEGAMSRASPSTRQHPVQHGPPRPPGGLPAPALPGFPPRRVDGAALLRDRLRHRRALPLVGRLAPDLVRRDHRARRRAHRRAGRLPRRESAPSTTGCLRDRRRRRSPRTTPDTARTAGRTTSASTPTTR